MVHNIVCLTCIAVIFQNVVFGVESKTPIELNLESVIELSRQRTLDIQLSVLQDEISAVRASAAQARLSGLEVDIDTAYRSEGDEQNDYGITIKQKLDLWRKQPRAQSAAAQLQIQTAQTQLLSLSVIHANIQTYYNAISSREQLELATQSTLLFQELLKTTETKSKAGVSGELDLNRARIALARSQSDQTRHQVIHDRHLTTLQTQLDLSLDQVIILKGELSWAHLEKNVHSKTKITMPALDLFHHPKMSVIDAELLSAQAQISSAQASGKPEIGLLAGYGQEEGTDIGRIGVSLEFQVGSRTTAHKQEAQIQLQSAEITYDKTRKTLLIECTSLWHQYQILKSTYEMHSTIALDAFDRNAELVSKSYQAGQLPIGDVLNIRRELIEAKQEQLTLKHAVASAALDFSIAAALPPFTQNTTTITE